MPTIDSLQKRIDNLEDRIRFLEKKPFIRRPKPVAQKRVIVYKKPVNGIHSKVMDICGVSDYQLMMNSNSRVCAQARKYMLFILYKKIGFSATVAETGISGAMMNKAIVAVKQDDMDEKIPSEYISLFEEHNIEI